jgi:hypothetical protein
MSETTENTKTPQPYYSPKFFKGSVVRKLIKESGRRVSPEFLQILDRHIEAKIKKACETHNGSKKTLDAAVAGVAGIGLE